MLEERKWGQKKAQKESVLGAAPVDNRPYEDWPHEQWQPDYRHLDYRPFTKRPIKGYTNVGHNIGLYIGG